MGSEMCIRDSLSGSIKIKTLNNSVNERLENMIKNNLRVIVGDANGADIALQKYFDSHGYRNLVVYCVGAPRNNVSAWDTEVVITTLRPGSRAYYTAKDEVMAEHCDFGFMVWDTKSPGTLKNVLELLKADKKSVVYVNNRDEFVNVSSIDDFERLSLIHI